MTLLFKRPPVVILIAAVLVSVLIGTVFVRSELKRAGFHGSEKRIDIGGYRLLIDCKGEGSPAVVMDAGLSHGIQTWDRVAPQIAKSTFVCTYDRAGIGGSDAGPAPRTSQQISNELDILLAKAKVPAPYVLVAHSFGGLNVRLYAGQHPEKVAGMVLVDPSHENQTSRFALFMEPEERKMFIEYEKGNNPEHVDVITSAMQVRESPPIRSMPFVVITAAYEDWLPKTNQIDRVRQELHMELVRSVPNSIHINAEGSGHYVQLDRPELVIQAIQGVLAQVRKR